MQRLKFLLLLVWERLKGNARHAAPAIPVYEHDEEIIGPVTYLDGLLDTLDDYMNDLRSLRRAVPDLYDLYSRVGATLVQRSESKLFDCGSLSSTWGSRRPSVGMVHIALHRSDKIENRKKWYPSFIAFFKTKPAPLVERTTDDVYAVYVVMSKIRRRVKNVVALFHVSVDEYGDVTALKHFEDHKWKIPEALSLISKNGREGRCDPQLTARDLFHLAANTAAHGEAAGWQVRCKRNGITAQFGIDLLRTPYFFKDREKTVTVNGRTRPICHIVRTHRRKTGQYVRSHLRGLREFKWNGYSVVVSMIDKHHIALSDFDVAATESDKLRRGHIGTDILGDQLSAHFRGAIVSFGRRNPSFTKKGPGRRALA